MEELNPTAKKIYILIWLMKSEIYFLHCFSVKESCLKIIQPKVHNSCFEYLHGERSHLKWSVINIFCISEKFFVHVTVFSHKQSTERTNRN